MTRSMMRLFPQNITMLTLSPSLHLGLNMQLQSWLTERTTYQEAHCPSEGGDYWLGQTAANQQIQPTTHPKAHLIKPQPPKDSCTRCLRIPTMHHVRKQTDLSQNRVTGKPFRNSHLNTTFTNADQHMCVCARMPLESFSNRTPCKSYHWNNTQECQERTAEVLLHYCVL